MSNHEDLRAARLAKVVEANFAEQDILLISEGLRLLIDVKREALKTVEGSVQIGRPWQDYDFGIPQIKRLQKVFGDDHCEVEGG